MTCPAAPRRRARVPRPRHDLPVAIVAGLAGEVLQGARAAASPVVKWPRIAASADAPCLDDNRQGNTHRVCGDPKTGGFAGGRRRILLGKEEISFITNNYREIHAFIHYLFYSQGDL